MAGVPVPRNPRSSPRWVDSEGLYPEPPYCQLGYYTDCFIVPNRWLPGLSGTCCRNLFDSLPVAVAVAAASPRSPVLRPGVALAPHRDVGRFSPVVDPLR